MFSFYTLDWMPMKLPLRPTLSLNFMLILSKDNFLFCSQDIKFVRCEKLISVERFEVLKFKIILSQY